MRGWLVDGVAWGVLIVGVTAGYGNLRGWFRHADRAAFLRWALETETGIPLSDPRATSFVQRFPPPANADRQAHGEFTYLTKTAMKSSGGGAPIAGFVTYMHADTTRTGSVATFDDVRRWADETPYAWLAWSLTALGGTLTIARGIAARRRATAAA